MRLDRTFIVAEKCLRFQICVVCQTNVSPLGQGAEKKNSFALHPDAHRFHQNAPKDALEMQLSNLVTTYNRTPNQIHDRKEGIKQMWAQNPGATAGTKFPTHQSTSLKTLSPLALV